MGLGRRLPFWPIFSGGFSATCAPALSVRFRPILFGIFTLPNALHFEVQEEASGYVLHSFPTKVKKAHNSCATKPDNSKTPRHFLFLPVIKMNIFLPFLSIVFSSVAIAAPVMATKVNSDSTVTLNSVGKSKVGSTKTVQQKKSKGMVNHAKKKGGKKVGITQQPVLTKRDNADGTITYKTSGKPKADLSETISLKESKEIDKQAKEIGVKVIDIKEQPVMTKKVNSDGSVTYNLVDDSKADSPETVPPKQGKDIEKQAEDTGVKVIEIKEQPVMTKKLNPDGTVTYNPVGEPSADTPETILKKEGKEVDDRFKELGVKVIDVTPKRDITHQQ